MAQVDFIFEALKVLVKSKKSSLNHFMHIAHEQSHRGTTATPLATTILNRWHVQDVVVKMPCPTA